MDQRVIQPDGKTVARLRRERGWTQAVLAAQAHCHKRTIERLEDSVGVFPRILKTVGEALGVDPQTLVATTRPESPGHEMLQGHPPFIAGPPITHPRAFFGRERVLQRLFSLWQQVPLQHAAIIGPRRSGKTSLLLYLQHITTAAPDHVRPGQRTDWLPDPTRYRWVYVDFQDPRLRHREALLSYLLTACGLAEHAPCGLESFMEVVSRHLHFPTIILLDEIGVALQRAPELDEDVWEGLRSLAATQVHGNLAFVLAARQAPTQLVADHRQGSPFLNMFAYTAELGPLTEPEARALLASSPCRFSADDIDWILAASGRWPYLLQILGRERLSALQDGAVDATWRAEGERQITAWRDLLEAV
jgi:hypothetical protein